MTRILEVNDLCVLRGRTSVLTGVSIEVAQGEALTILGASGSGKTTILLAIGGLLERSAMLRGEVVFRGRSLTGVPPHERGIPLVLQDLGLFEHLSVLGNVMFAPQRRGLSHAAVRRRSMEILDSLSIAELASRHTGTLSAGQRQRVALARALVLEPEMLMLDEPTSALDSLTAGQFAELLASLRRRRTMSMLLATHDRAFASRISDRIAVLAGGGIAQMGTLAEVAARPRNSVVARLIGHRNVFNICHEGETKSVGIWERLGLSGERPSSCAAVLLPENRVCFSATPCCDISMPCQLTNVSWDSGQTLLELTVDSLVVYSSMEREPAQDLKAGVRGFLCVRRPDVLLLEG